MFLLNQTGGHNQVLHKSTVKTVRYLEPLQNDQELLVKAMTATCYMLSRVVYYRLKSRSKIQKFGKKNNIINPKLWI